jgi:hypothetical protein
MLKKDENALTMIYTVKQGCDQKESVWTGYKPFRNSYTLFTAKIPVIEGFRDKQILDIRGHAMDKEALRFEISVSAFHISGQLSSFAKSIKNRTLLKEVDYSSSQLNGMRDTTLTGACSILIKNATDNLDDLDDYEITQAVIDQFRTSVNQYLGLVASPRIAVSDRKAAGGMLSQTIKETKLILKERLDLDAEHFKTINPEFYSFYKSARDIPDYGTRKKGQKETIINGECVDFETHNPKAGVTVKILGQGVEMVTGAEGKYSLKVKTPGEVTLRAEMEGCTPWEDELILEKGDVLTIMIEMEKIEEEQ